VKYLRLLLVCLFATLAVSADAAESVAHGTSFSVVADHDGVNTTSYRLYVNGVLTETKSVTERQGNVISFARTASQTGTYVFYVEAVGEGGAVASTTLSVTVSAPTPARPSAPSNLRMVKAPSGSTNP
jgi:hypothetical protein